MEMLGELARTGPVLETVPRSCRVACLKFMSTMPAILGTYSSRFLQTDTPATSQPLTSLYAGELTQSLRWPTMGRHSKLAFLVTTQQDGGSQRPSFASRINAHIAHHMHAERKAKAAKAYRPLVPVASLNGTSQVRGVT